MGTWECLVDASMAVAVDLHSTLNSLNSLRRVQTWDLAALLLATTRARRLHDLVSSTALLTACVRAGRWQVACALMMELAEVRLEAETQTCFDIFLISSFAGSLGCERMRELVEDRNISWYDVMVWGVQWRLRILWCTTPSCPQPPPRAKAEVLLPKLKSGGMPWRCWVIWKCCKCRWMSLPRPPSWRPPGCTELAVTRQHPYGPGILAFHFWTVDIYCTI